MGIFACDASPINVISAPAQNRCICISCLTYPCTLGPKEGIHVQYMMPHLSVYARHKMSYIMMPQVSSQAAEWPRWMPQLVTNNEGVCQAVSHAVRPHCIVHLAVSTNWGVPFVGVFTKQSPTAWCLY